MRADRLLAILMLLQSKGRITARDLAEELEVSERTVYRDMDALSMAGVPVVAERGPGGGCALLEGYRTNLTGLHEAEVRALFLARIAGPLAELGLLDAGEAAVRKLSAALPAPHRHTLEQMRARIHLDPDGWSQLEEPVPHLALVQEAVWRDRRLRVTYRREDGGKVRRFLEPYGLVAKGHIWYAVGAVVDQARVYGVAHVRRARHLIYTYRVSRILDAALLDEPFVRPDDFDLRQWWAAWCAEFEAGLPRYDVTLRVPTDLVPVLPRVFGEGVYTLLAASRPPDAEGRITLTLTFDSPDTACRQVLALGAGAEVLAPAALRAQILDSAARVVAFYLSRESRVDSREL